MWQKFVLGYYGFQGVAPVAADAEASTYFKIRSNPIGSTRGLVGVYGLVIESWLGFELTPISHNS